MIYRNHSLSRRVSWWGGTFLLLLGTTAAHGQTYSEAVLAHSPVAYWRLGETSGTTLLDSAGSHNGTYRNGVTLGASGAVYGDTNTAAAFDGNNDRVEVPHSDAFLLANGTFMAWIKPDSTADSAFFSKDALNFVTGGHFSAGFSSGYVGARLQSTSNSYYVFAPAPPLGEWTHVTVTWGSGGMRLYINGQHVYTNGYTGGWGNTSGGVGNYEPIAIGVSRERTPSGNITPVRDYYDGIVDEIAIFPTVLNSTQIQAIYDAALPKYTSLRHAYQSNNPVAWWRLGEFPGSTIAEDEFGTHDGTYAGPILGQASIIPKDYAADFDGVDDSVELGSIDVSGNAMTILAWFRADDWGIYDGRFICKTNGFGTQSHFWMLGHWDDGFACRLRFRTRTNDITTTLLAPTGDLAVGEWTFAAGVYNGSYMILYKNAVEVGRMSKGGALSVDPATFAAIGNNPIGTGNKAFDGLLDEVALFDRALTLQELQAIYKHSFTPPAGVRILNWREVSPAE